MELHKAVLRYGCTKSEIELLIRKGANVNKKDSFNNSPLHYALITKCKNEVIQLLIDSGADINLRGLFGKCPLHRLLSYTEPQMDVIKILLDQKANINVTDGEGNSPLHYALLSQCMLNVIRFLVESGADVNLKSGEFFHNSPLHYAVKCLKPDINIVEYLLSVGADVNALNRARNSPLYYALCSGDIDIVKSLVNHGAELNVKPDKHFLEALDQSKKRGFLDCWKFFIKYCLLEDVKCSEVFKGDFMNDMPGFVEQCKQEVEKMITDTIAGTTLIALIKNRRRQQGPVIDCDPNNLLIVFKNYPLYREILALLIERKDLVVKTEKILSSNPNSKEMAALRCFVVHQAESLSKQDAINIALAYLDEGEAVPMN